jgi:hypothetical protein
MIQRFPMLCSCQKSMGMVVHRDTYGLFSQIVLSNQQVVVLVDQSLVFQLRNYGSGMTFREILMTPGKTIRDAVNMTSRSLYRQLKVLPDYIVVTGSEMPLTCGMNVAGVFRSVFNYLLGVDMGKDVDVAMIQMLCENDIRGGTGRTSNVLGKMFTKTMHYLDEKQYLQGMQGEQGMLEASDAECVGDLGAADAADAKTASKKEIFDASCKMKNADDVFVRKYDHDTDAQFFGSGDYGGSDHHARLDMVWVPPGCLGRVM